jgi:hypothetical protein
MASGDTLLVFTPLNNEAPSTSYPTLDVRNDHPVLDYPDDTYKDALFTAVLPRSYAGGGLTVAIYFAMSSATSGNVVWKAAIERIGEVLDIDSDGFAAYQAQIKAVAGTCGMAAKAEIEFTDGAQMDSLVAGELFRLKVRRDGGDGSDNASGDAELLAVEVGET